MSPDPVLHLLAYNLVRKLKERGDDVVALVRDPAGAADLVAFLELQVVAHDGGADVVLLEVERDADDAVLELEHLQRDRVFQAVGAGDAVADLENGADFGEIGLDVVVLDPVLQDRGDFFGP